MTLTLTLEDSHADKLTFLKKCSWDATDKVRWQGEPPRIEVLVDSRYHWYFLLKAFIQASPRTCPKCGRTMSGSFSWVSSEGGECEKKENALSGGSRLEAGWRAAADSAPLRGAESAGAS